MTNPAPDPARVDAFAERLLGVINGAGLALMISIGHRTGLFDTMAGRAASTSRELAEAAGLTERYVREWLGALVTGRIVEHDPEARTYWLPAEHAESLTRAAAPANMASTMQWIAVLGGVEDGIVECFRRGGGLPYAAYDRFHEVMADESDQTTVSHVVESIVPLVPGAQARLREGATVLDVGCGSARALARLAAEYPQSRFFGYDLSPDAVAAGRAAARARGLENFELAVRDLSDLDEPGRFDLILAFDAIHDQAKPDLVLTGISRALRPDGTFLMQDIKASSHHHENLQHPLGPFLYAISCMHCMSVSLEADGMGLGAVWGEETARRMLSEAGFADVSVHELEHDPLNSYYVCKKG